MNKTVYLRDSEVPIWEKARELSGDKLSPIIVSALRQFVKEKDAQPNGYERILLQFNDALDHNLPKKKAFYGRWLIDLSKPLQLPDEQNYEFDIYSVAETARGGVVVYKHTASQEWMSGHKFLYYPSFQQAAADQEVNVAIREALERRGVPVEELDI
jgi:hypothetical protein